MGEEQSGELAGRRFLLATMPVGPFSRALAEALRGAGARVTRVIFNGGDLWDWGLGEVVWAGSRPWPDRLATLIDDEGVTDVVVFGDVQPYSAAALAAASRAGLRTWVLENGYLRPSWVTLERGGVNANSALPSDPGAYDDEPPADLAAEAPKIAPITPFHVAHMMIYITWTILAWPLFPSWRYPFALRIWPQAWNHLRRYGLHLVRRRRWEWEALACLADRRPFFLLCLQREGDSQLTQHSSIGSNAALMDQVIGDFARHAPAASRLVVKNHPLDPGVENLRRRCAQIASRHGCAERVTFLEAGVFAALARASQGVISVNSTAALAALQFGCPVKLLGRAFFDIPGLVDQRPLDQFWQARTAPDPELFRRFHHRLARTTQVFGNFHNRRHLRSTAEGVALRMR